MSEVSCVHTLKGIYFSELKNFVLSLTRRVHMPSAYIYFVAEFYIFVELIYSYIQVFFYKFSFSIAINDK